MLRLLAVLLAGALAVFPVLAQETAPIDGARSDLDRLAGEWTGRYACEETGRHGTLLFRLDIGADSLIASILMTPRATGDLVPTPVPLAVHRVSVEGRSFRGSLARYSDPEWDLPLETTFSGALTGDDRIEGAFRADGTTVDTVPRCGRWWASRAASPPGGPRLDL